MDIVNRITKGVHSDHDPRYQPEGTIRESYNGRFIGKEGNFFWENYRGDLSRITLSYSDQQISTVNEKIIGYVILRNRLILFWFANNSMDPAYDINAISIYTINPDGTYTLERTFCWNKAINWFGWTTNTHIHGYGIFIDDTHQYAVITDNVDPPWIFNIVDPALVSYDPTMFRFTPDTNMGLMNLDSILASGSLNHGTYFFSYQLYHISSGAWTEWSQTSDPIQIFMQPKGTTLNQHEQVQTRANTVSTTKGIRMKISGINTLFTNIRVVAFRTVSYNVIDTGVVFFDGPITGSSMTFDYTGEYQLDTLLITDLSIHGITITRARDLTTINKRNVVADIDERPELPIGQAMTGAVVSEEIQEFLFDQPATALEYRGIYPKNNRTPNKVLAGTKFYAKRIACPGRPIVDTALLYPGYWYKCIGDITIDATPYEGAPTPYGVGTYPWLGDGSYFQVNTSLAGGPPGDDLWLLLTGKVETYLRIAKYTDNAAVVHYDEYLVDDDFIDFKSELIRSKFMGYPSQEMIRLGVLFWDKQGKPFAVRYIEDYTTLARSVGIGNYLVRGIGRTGAASDYIYHHYMSSVEQLTIDGLDITSIKDLISGFSIVRCPIKRQRLAYGIIEPTHLFTPGKDIIRYGQFTQFDWDGGNDNDCMPNIYVFLSPEHLVEFDKIAFGKGDKIEVVRHLMADRREEVPGGTPGFIESYNYLVLGNTYYNKFYNQTDAALTPVNGFGTNASIGHQAEVLDAVPVVLGDDTGLIITESLSQNLFKNRGILRWGGADNYSRGSKCVVLNIDNYEIGGGSNKLNRYNCPIIDPTLTIVSHFRPLSDDPYGSIGSSQYIMCGHYQVVDSAFLASIKVGNNYIVNGIHIFGGDTFIVPFSIYRAYRDEDAGKQSGSAVIVPLESRVNWPIKEGYSINKDGSYDLAWDTTGLRWKATANIYHVEDFIYNSAYSSDDIGDRYPALPDNFYPQTTFDNFYRWSNVKVGVEKDDSLRHFLPNNFQFMDYRFGKLTGVRVKKQRLFYWQDDSFGYIPVSEKVMAASEFGTPIQLGLGGEFLRSDEITSRIGTQHTYSIIETESGFIWYDGRGKEMYRYRMGGNVDPLGLSLGFKNILLALPEDYEGNDNPSDLSTPYPAIIGGYWPMEKTAFMHFASNGDDYLTLGVNDAYSLFTGKYGLRFRYGFEHFRRFMHADGGKIISEFGQGNRLDAYVTFIIGNQEEEQLLYNIMHINKGVNPWNEFAYTKNKFFSSVEIMTTSQFVNEVLMDASVNILVDALVYAKNQWHYPLPLQSEERLNGQWLWIKFIVSPAFAIVDSDQPSRIASISTAIRKYY